MKAIEQKQPSLVRNKILFSEIEFFSSEEVTLIGEIEMNGKTEFAQYITNKKNLYLLLKNSGKVGQEIIYMIMDAFKRPHEVPVALHLKEIFGKAVCLQHCAVKLDRSFYENEAGEWKVDYNTNLFFIDAVKPLEAEPVPAGLF
ncbi:MAG: hypothetical protein JWO03_124 [Bacteroidetes bacterium]|nr:hypothetical protein [Bacteroidota bacterium]